MLVCATASREGRSATFHTRPPRSSSATRPAVRVATSLIAAHGTTLVLRASERQARFTSRCSWPDHVDRCSFPVASHQTRAPPPGCSVLTQALTRGVIAAAKSAALQGVYDTSCETPCRRAAGRIRR
jgi:hypothetical protein